MLNLPWLAVILALTALSGCPAGIQWEPEMPASLDGGWKLEKVERAPPENAPELLRQLQVADGMESVYGGPGKLTVSVYRLRTASSAFEAVQKWRPEPGRVVFHTGGVFTIVSSPDLDNAGLNRVARELEQKWSRGR